MSRVFKVMPKRVKRVNGTVLTPEIEIVAATKIGTSNPFYNNAQEIKEAYSSTTRKPAATSRILSLRSWISNFFGIVKVNL